MPFLPTHWLERPGMFVMTLLQKLVAVRRFFASLNGALYMVQNMV
jgi:hypothetical protein